MSPLQERYFNLCKPYLNVEEYEQAIKEIKSMNAAELRQAIKAMQ